MDNLHQNIAADNRCIKTSQNQMTLAKQIPIIPPCSIDCLLFNINCIVAFVAAKYKNDIVQCPKTFS
jgi:hypothetical protein